MAQKPSIPKGTRDFSPVEVARRTYIFETIKRSFKKYGFAPIETPSFELSTTLMGKYGEEGDRLIFRILNSGEYLKNEEIKIKSLLSIENALKKTIENFTEYENNHNRQNKQDINLYLNSQFKRNFNISGSTFIESNEIYSIGEKINKLFQNDISNVILSNRQLDYKDLAEKAYSEIKKKLKDDVLDLNSKALNSVISQKALRYDLTVPFARFVVQHQNDLAFPFKRYQIQPVWRADRPQHGRYQEFYQCDADVVGSDSLVYEIDFVLLFDEVLSDLKLPGFTVKINNRKILSGIAEVSGESDKLIDITVAIDKLDKIGEEGVVNELREKGVSEEAIQKISPLFSFSGSNAEKLKKMADFLSQSEIGMKGIEELKFVLDQVEMLGLSKAELEFDITLARGLNYYTGAIFEVKVHEVKMGSICGGGRYDDLTGLFGMKGMSGVGISFGADRIYDVLTELDLFPKETDQGLTLMFVNFGDKEQAHCLKLVKTVRDAGIDCELYPSAAKMQKQMKYANDRGVQFVALIGENEIQNQTIQLKNMESGEQGPVSINELIERLK